MSAPRTLVRRGRYARKVYTDKNIAPGCIGCRMGTFSMCKSCQANVCGGCLVRHECGASE